MDDHEYIHESLSTHRDAAGKTTTTRMVYHIYTREGCSYCEELKTLLKKHDVKYVELVCDNLQDARTQLGPTVVAHTFPIVLDLDTHTCLGGYDHVFELLEEPLLRPSTTRFTPFPIVYEDVYDLYKKGLASFWTVDEISLRNDVTEFSTLTKDEQHFIKHVLAFFAASDGIVNENLANRFSVEVQIPECRLFYAHQTLSEAVHSQMYGILIDSLVKDPAERTTLFRAIDQVPSVKKKAEWALHWLHSSKKFAQRLVAYVCVEGLLFSGSFCAIFWLKQRGLMPGLSLSNQFISRDEGLHYSFGTLLYRKYLVYKLSQKEVCDIVRDAVENEKEFVCQALPVDLVGMNSRAMSDYIEFVADRLLVDLGHAKMFHTQNPFDWMNMIGMESKDNFFERFSSEYQRAGVMANTEDQVFALDEAF
jgi:ribonucleotide reductase beta subunit family protein with ferritin-like domain/glutaredoxin